MNGNMRLRAAKGVFPTRLDTKSPSTMLYTEANNIMPIVGIVKRKRTPYVKWSESLIFIARQRSGLYSELPNHARRRLFCSRNKILNDWSQGIIFIAPRKPELKQLQLSLRITFKCLGLHFHDGLHLPASLIRIDLLQSG